MKFKDNRDCRICGMKLLRSKMNNLADRRPFLVSPRDGGGWLWLEMVETGYKIVVWVWHSPIVIPQPIPALAYLAVLLGIYSDAILASLSPLVLLQIHVDMQPQLAYHQHTDTIRTQLFSNSVIMQTINMKLTFGSINTISQIIAFICQLSLWYIDLLVWLWDISMETKFRLYSTLPRCF